MPFNAFIGQVPASKRVTCSRIYLEGRAFVRDILVVGVRVGITGLEFGTYSYRRHIVIICTRPVGIFRTVVFRYVSGSYHRISHPGTGVRGVHFVFFFMGLLRRVDHWGTSQVEHRLVVNLGLFFTMCHGRARLRR